MNIWHDIDPSSIKPEKFMAVIEIPAGSKKSMSWISAPVCCAWIGSSIPPPTTRPTTASFPAPMPMTATRWMCWCCAARPWIRWWKWSATPSGWVRMVDGEEYDDKIIAIPLEDPTWNYYQDVNQLPPHILNEIANFFEVYKSLEHKSTTLSNTLGREAALQIIRETLYTYECHFCGRME